MTPVTPLFLSQLRLVGNDGNGGLVAGLLVLHPIVDEASVWALGVVPSPPGYTMTAELQAELIQATANADGTYTRIDGAVRELVGDVSTHACESASKPPPPPPPPPG